MSLCLLVCPSVNLYELLTLYTLYIRAAQKKEILLGVASDGRGYYKMILFLLFSISLAIRASAAQKPNQFFFHGAQSTRNAAEIFFFLNRGFVGWIKI